MNFGLILLRIPEKQDLDRLADYGQHSDPIRAAFPFEVWISKNINTLAVAVNMS